MEKNLKILFDFPFSNGDALSKVLKFPSGRCPPYQDNDGYESVYKIPIYYIRNIRNIHSVFGRNTQYVTSILVDWGFYKIINDEWDAIENVICLHGKKTPTAIKNMKFMRPVETDVKINYRFKFHKSTYNNILFFCKMFEFTTSYVIRMSLCTSFNAFVTSLASETYFKDTTGFDEDIVVIKKDLDSFHKMLQARRLILELSVEEKR